MAYLPECVEVEFSEVYRWSGFRVLVRSPHLVREGEQCESPYSTRRCNSGSSYAIWRRRYGGTWTTTRSARGSSQIDLGDANNYREYGQPGERSNRTAVATVGQVMGELIEPLDEEGIHARFL